MRKTYCEVDLEFVDVKAKKDASYSASREAYSNLSLLSNADNEVINGATLELNSFILDGTKEFIPNNYTYPWISYNWSSGKNKYTNTYIDIEFSTVHSTQGITLTFVDRYPTKIEIVWMYNDCKLSSNVYEVENLQQFFKNSVFNFNHIRINILESAFPKQMVKLNNIMYGRHILWGTDDLKSANVFESLDVTSSTIEINTARIEVIDKHNTFDLYSENGDWKLIQQGQKVDIYEYVDDDKIFIGTFYVNKFENNKNVLTLSLQDGIGLLTNSTYNNGHMYENISAYDVLVDIFNDANFTQYNIDEEINDIYISGYLLPQEHRKAIQQVCFGIGACVDCSKSDKVNVYIPHKSIKHTILKDRKFDVSTVKLNTYYSGVSTEYTLYKKSAEARSSEIYNNKLSAGEHTIYFNAPYYNYEIDNGTLLTSSENYVNISVTSNDNDVIIRAIPYGKYTQSNNVSVEELSAGLSENIQRYNGMTIVSNTDTLAKNLLNDAKLRKEVNIKFQANTEKVGDWCQVEQKDNSGKYSISRIISQSIDLTGGYISTARCHGWEDETTYYYYAGELYSGQEGVM